MQPLVGAAYPPTVVGQGGPVKPPMSGPTLGTVVDGKHWPHGPIEGRIDSAGKVVDERMAVIQLPSLDVMTRDRRRISACQGELAEDQVECLRDRL